MQEGMPPLSITMIMSNQALGGRNPLFSKRGGEIAWWEGGRGHLKLVLSRWRIRLHENLFYDWQ